MRTTSSWWLLNMAESFRRMNLSVRELFEEAGISFQSLMYADTRFPQDGVTALWHLAEERTSNREIGFDVGKRLNIAGLPILGYSIISAHNLKEGFNRFFRYQRVLGESATINLRYQEDEVHLSFNFVGDSLPICQHTYDMAIAATVSMIRVLAGESWAPQTLHLSRAKPSDLNAFERFYQCPIAYRSEGNILVLAASDFEVQLDTQHAFDISLLSAEADHGSNPISRLLSMYITQHLQDPSLDKSQAAEALNMSPRSLQRKLKAEGMSYQKLLDQVRKERAIEYLASPNLSLTAIAFLCGFSDATAFNRAFKRWHGVSPGQYRLENTAGPQER